jgi:putative hydrolase of the HAD superfamily
MGVLRDKKCALFDLGSTLIEYENIPWNDIYKACLKNAYNYLCDVNVTRPEWDKFYETFLEMVISVEAESYKTYQEPDIYLLFRDFLATFNLPCKQKMIDDFLGAYYIPIRENLTLIENTVEVLEFFKSNGHKLGLISNTVFPPHYHIEDMRHFRIEHFFDKMIFSSDFRCRKPHLSIFQEMLRCLDISASHSFFVGDRMDVDVIGANEAGIFSVLKFRKGRDYPDLNVADLVVYNHSELIDYY